MVGLLKVVTPIDDTPTAKAGEQTGRRNNLEMLSSLRFSSSTRPSPIARLIELQKELLKCLVAHRAGFSQVGSLSPTQSSFAGWWVWQLGYTEIFIKHCHHAFNLNVYRYASEETAKTVAMMTYDRIVGFRTAFAASTLLFGLR